MIDLYAAPTSNGIRAKIVLDECELPYTLHKVDLAKGEHKQPEYLKLNPMGVIPTIVDHEGPGGRPVTLAQSVAIMTYVAEKAGRFVPKSEAQRPAFLEALTNAATDVGPTLSSVFYIARSQDPHKPSQEIFETRYRDLLKFWDGTLAKSRYCAGDEVTIADFALYAVVARCDQVIPELNKGFANVEKWASEIGVRPGVKKGMTF